MLPRHDGIELGLLYRPIRRVGVCIPGGAAAYPSSLLMTVVPAQAAGVAEIAVVVPADPVRRLQHGHPGRLPRARRHRGLPDRRRPGGRGAGVRRRAIGLEPVDKIVGPGNLFVALAKQHVFGTVDIDSIAGPSEVVLIADGIGDAGIRRRRPDQPGRAFPGASILLTWEPDLIDRVARRLDDQLARLSRGDLARDSLERFGALVLVRDEDEAVATAESDRARAPACRRRPIRSGLCRG